MGLNHAQNFRSSQLRVAVRAASVVRYFTRRWVESANTGYISFLWKFEAGVSRAVLLESSRPDFSLPVPRAECFANNNCQENCDGRRMFEQCLCEIAAGRIRWKFNFVFPPFFRNFVTTVRVGRSRYHVTHSEKILIKGTKKQD